MTARVIRFPPRRHALLRDSQGHAASPLGAALDLIAGRAP
jgi:hypothetical protein